MIIAYLGIDCIFRYARREGLRGNSVLKVPNQRKQHPKGGKPTGPVYEGQTPEYGGTGIRHPDTVHGPGEGKYHRPCTSQQYDAPLGHRVQPEEVPEIRTRTVKKRGGPVCFCKKHLKMSSNTCQVYL